ncbi:laccase [Boletus edulis]|uniref:Type-2 Cu-depleted laccase from coprinus Cinereus At 1.68 A resolution n=1 Tax=Boletus edulis BED1 TaxID=1328754 RepID=A0AAD4BLK9_BOLED|nr:laccase [Boletus edulis]KAF8434383.1 type-2 Cu-depleted laccase from coprinus Cinereus At 1.68 A resolution [Boletus edulis BED1]
MPTNVAVLGPVGQLYVTNNVISPDGYSRSAITVNGVYPAPLIKANKNDQFNIELVNGLTDDSMSLETAVHFHGMFQRKSNWADGATSVTQCPLRQKETFVQKFNTTGQTGTYWYHSHYAVQRCEGFQGPLVIYDPEDPLAALYDVDDENTVITLSDWYQSPYALKKTFAMPNSTLINGMGRYTSGPSAPLSVINVQQGLRYRFRVIAMSCESNFNFTVDGHRMTIIEADGNEVSSVEVDSIPIHPGQRYSVVVSADQPVGNYWIRALSNTPNATFDGGQSMAILRYEGAAHEDPTSPPGPYELSFDEGDLHPLIIPGAPGIPEIGKADVNLVLAPGITPEHNYTLNNVTYVAPPVPVLLQILSGARQATDFLPKGSVYALPPNKVVEISFPNPAAAPGAPHPVHLHGNNFHVVRSAGSNKTNFIDPIRRDVVSIGKEPTDNVTIRFVTDNPGPWFLHCHMDYHFSHGFAVVLAVASNETADEESIVVPQDWSQLCKKQD